MKSLLYKFWFSGNVSIEMFDFISKVVSKKKKKHFCVAVTQEVESITVITWLAV